MVRISINGMNAGGGYFDMKLCREIKEKAVEFLADTPYSGAEVSVADNQHVIHDGYPNWSLGVSGGNDRDKQRVHQILAPLSDMFCERIGMGNRVLIAKPVYSA